MNTETDQLPAPQITPPTATTPVETPNPLATVSSVLGVVDLLSPAQELALQACESVVASGWVKYVQVGLALAQIRDEQLYRNDYDSFEAYCRERWGFQRAHVYRLIAAAQVSQQLAATPNIPQPDHETQVRPLTGLNPASALLAWQYAASICAGGSIRPNMVKRAVQQLQLAEPVAAQASPNRPARPEHRKNIRAGFNELLTLLLQKAGHDVLLEKVQALQRRVDLIMGVPKRKK